MLVEQRAEAHSGVVDGLGVFPLLGFIKALPQEVGQRFVVALLAQNVFEHGPGLGVVGVVE